MVIILSDKFHVYLENVRGKAYPVTKIHKHGYIFLFGIQNSHKELEEFRINTCILQAYTCLIHPRFTVSECSDKYNCVQNTQGKNRMTIAQT